MRPPVIISLLALVLMALVVFAGLRREPVSVAAPAAANTSPTMLPTFAPVRNTPTGREPMVLSDNYRETFVQYAQVDRSDNITRKLYITPSALDALRAGLDFPERTQIIIEAYDAARDAEGNVLRDASGHLLPGDFDPRVHFAEFRSTWRIADLAASSRVGNWNFSAQDYITHAPTGEALADCFSCHTGADRTGFLYSRPQLDRYLQTDTVQYRTCALPGRFPCA
jgi:hypothetical protein